MNFYDNVTCNLYGYVATSYNVVYYTGCPFNAPDSQYAFSAYSIEILSL